jgi:hypothetical protein
MNDRRGVTSTSNVTVLPRDKSSAVRAELERVLESPPFRPSRRCQKLLVYLVEETLNGKADALKERTVGVDVFGRSPAYDTSEDSSVRVCAGEIRKRLAQYYVDAAHIRELRIELPPGSYVPLFHWTGQARNGTDIPLNEPAQGAPAVSILAWLRAQPRGRVVVGVVVAAVVLVCATWAGVARRKSALADFWGPVLTGNGSVLVCVGGHLAYMPRGALRARINSRVPSDQEIDNAAIQLSPDEKVTGADFGGSIDQQVNTDDAHSASLLSQLAGRYEKEIQFRLTYTSTMDDLRNGPTLLVGAFNNRWALALGEHLPFALEGDWTKGPVLIRERQGERRQWSLSPSVPGTPSQVDHALISRILHGSTGKPLLQIGGISPAGTLAAAEFVTSEALLSSALSTSMDWKNKNVQIVLRVLIANRNADAMEVAAIRIW